MKKINLNLLIIFFLFILYIVYFRMFYSNVELFEIVNSIDFYVITMSKDDRLNNIKSQIEKQIQIIEIDDTKNNKNNKFNFSIEIVDAVVGKNLDLQNLFDKNIINEKICYDVEKTSTDNNILENFNNKIENRKNEMGCYLSHLKIYDIIKSKNQKGYSVIFEDDFELEPDFMYKLEESILKLKSINFDFDFLFLGGLLGNNDINVIDNIYYTSENCFQTHGYLINNINIDKIIENLKFIEDILDVQIFKKGLNRELTVLKIDPVIVYQNFDKFGSDIQRDM